MVCASWAARGANRLAGNFLAAFGYEQRDHVGFISGSAAAVDDIEANLNLGCGEGSGLDTANPVIGCGRLRCRCPRKKKQHEPNKPAHKQRIPQNTQ